MDSKKTVCLTELKSVTCEQTFTAYIKAAAAATKIKQKISFVIFFFDLFRWFFDLFRVRIRSMWTGLT